MATVENVVTVLSEHWARAADPVHHGVRSRSVEWAVVPLLLATTEGVGIGH